MLFDEWKEILNAVSNLPGVDIFEQIKYELRQQDRDTYQQWEQVNFDINYPFTISYGPFSGGNTLLHLVALSGNEKIIKYLVEEKGADVNLVDDSGCNALHLAAYSNCKGIVEYLIEEKGVDVNLVDNDGNSTLHLAALGDRGVEIVKYLTNLPEININTIDRDGNTPLHSATEETRIDPEKVRILIDHGANVNATDYRGCTPLCHGSLYSPNFNGNDKVKAIKLLIEGGANVNVRCDNPPLSSAVKYGSTECVQLLLDYGADVNVIGNLPFLFHDRCNNVSYEEEDITEIAKLLIERGTNFDAQDHDGETLLHKIIKDYDSYFANDNYKELVKVLVEYTILKNPEIEKPSYSTAKEEISEYWDKCLYEVKRMEGEKISKGITFHNILVSKDSNELAFYMRNKNIEKRLATETYNSEFPIYANKIESQYKAGSQRRDALNVGEVVIKHFDGLNRQEGPFDLKIAEYLNNEDMKNLRKAAIQTIDEKMDVNKAAACRKEIKRETSFGEKRFSNTEGCSSSLSGINTESLYQARSPGC